jgi:hypothetical protein
MPMDMKLYMKVDGGERQELEAIIEMISDISEIYGLKTTTVGKDKVLERAEPQGEHFQVQLREPHGGKTLHELFKNGKRLTLWIVYGNKVAGLFTPLETYVIKHLMPYSRHLDNHSNYVQLTLATLSKPELQD